MRVEQVENFSRNSSHKNPFYLSKKGKRRNNVEESAFFQIFKKERGGENEKTN